MSAPMPLVLKRPAGSSATISFSVRISTPCDAIRPDVPVSGIVIEVETWSRRGWLGYGLVMRGGIGAQGVAYPPQVSDSVKPVGKGSVGSRPMVVVP